MTVIIAYDLDDTLFWYDHEDSSIAKIRVIKDGELISRIGKEEYLTHKLKEDESYDYAEFEDASIFEKTAKPVKILIDSIKRMTSLKMYWPYEVAIITARGPLEDMSFFKNVLKKHGIDTDLVHLKMCGIHRNMFDNTPERKKYAFVQLINSFNNVKTVIFYDDQISNLNSFLELKQSYPDITFDAHLVNVNAGKLSIRLLND